MFFESASQVDRLLPQHLCNCLWAAANLKEAGPEAGMFKYL